MDAIAAYFDVGMQASARMATPFLRDVEASPQARAIVFAAGGSPPSRAV